MPATSRRARHAAALPLRSLALALSLVLVATAVLSAPAAHAQPAYDPEARAAFLLDFGSGQVLYEKNADEPIPLASLTKIMTLYLAEEAIRDGKMRPDEKVAVSERAWSQNPALRGSSLMFLEPGQDVTVREILLGIAVASGNDACIALAEHMSGSVESFVERMNAKARELGLTHTHFVDPHGLSTENVSTAREIGLLAARYIREFPDVLRDLHSVKHFEYPKPQNLPGRLAGRPAIPQDNRNWLLWDKELPVDGLKTGYVEAAGYNYVVTAKQGETRLIGVLLGTASEAARAQQGRAFLRYGFANWVSVPAYKAGQKVAETRVWKGRSNRVDAVVPEAVWVAVPKGEEQKLVPALDVAQSVTAPVRKGQELGSVALFLGDREVRKVPVVAGQDVPPGGFFKRLWDSVRLLIQGLWSRLFH